MKHLYILDGKKVKEKDIRIRQLMRGFLYGDGVFETMRAVNYKIYMWDEHIEKIRQGARVCRIDVSEDLENIKTSIERHIKKERAGDVYIRINLWRKMPEIFDPGTEKEPHILVIIKKHHPYPEIFYKEGIRCIVSKKYFKNEMSPVVCIKTLNYLENIFARTEARDNRCDDAILLNTSGYLTSATVSNIFFVKKGKVYTPSVDCGIRAGTIRELVIKIYHRSGIKVNEGRFSVRDLEDVDEVFLTNTLMGVLPVREIKGIFEGRSFRISSFLKKEVEKSIRD
ncbi:MAG: aminotransferase class IV [Candidatus Ratteibacteria bacterium]|nr:aminotransferase class IV [Candidatus Ratteibacteria bacterium]